MQPGKLPTFFLVANVLFNDDTTGCVCMYPILCEWVMFVLTWLRTAEMSYYACKVRTDPVSMISISQCAINMFCSYLLVIIHCWTVHAAGCRWKACEC